MPKDIDQKGNPRLTILLVGIILVLGFMLLNQYWENEQAKQVFASQTARVEHQQSISLTATQQLEDKVEGCGDVFQEFQPTDGFNFNPACVVGLIYTVEETEKVDINEPQGYVAYFSPMPDTFFLYGIYDLRSYVDKCVKVAGQIQFLPPEAPAVYVEEYGENIEVLPYNMCQP